MLSRPSLAGLPPVLVLMYVLIGWEESFPVTATTSLLVHELHFPVPTVSTYYAVIFMPFMWKPLYGWISDTFPLFGYYRSPYIAISAALNALTFFFIAAFAHSAASMFALATVQMICIAFLQLMVGTFLVDVARRDVKQSARLMSVANSAKWAGTLLSQVMALILYARGTGSSLGPDSGVLSARQAIALTGISPALIAFSTPFLHETARTTSQMHGICCRRHRACVPCLQISTKQMRYALVVVLLQVNLAVIGCQYLMEQADWEKAMTICAAVTFLIGGVVLGCSWHYSKSRSREASEVMLEHSAERDKCSLWRWARIALFCFCANAIPTSGVSLGLLQFAVFNMESYQILGLISSAGSLCAAVAFGGVFGRWKIHNAKQLIPTSILVAAIAALAPFPFAVVSVNQSGEGGLHSDGTLWSFTGALAVSASIVGSISTVFSVLPITTMLTTACGLEDSDKSATALAVFLSCYSFGATVGGLICAAIEKAIGLTGKNWDSLPAFIVATACAKFIVLLLLPLLPTPPEQSPVPGEPRPASLGFDDASRSEPGCLEQAIVA